MCVFVLLPVVLPAVCMCTYIHAVADRQQKREERKQEKRRKKETGKEHCNSVIKSF
jgi:hypothetical protein